MTMVISLILAFVVGVRAEASTPPRERIAVAIGYSDKPDSFWQKAGLADYLYLPVMGQTTALLTSKLLIAHGFRLEREAEFLSTWVRGNLQIEIINPNERCKSALKIPGQELLEMRSSSLCPEQKEKSRVTANYVRENILRYDAFIYIGHARHGSGISFGAFNDNAAKVDVYSLARKHSGGNVSLKIVGMMSCDSVNHYAKAFDSLYDSKPPKFVGINAEKIDWYPPDLVNKELMLLKAILQSGGVSRYHERLPPKSAF